MENACCAAHEFFLAAYISVLIMGECENKGVPLPFVLCAQIVPLCSSTMFLDYI
jgi:hypothetical protein